MITLFGFGRSSGLPDPSPFVVKAEVLLKMAGLEYGLARADLRKAPKGKAPYIDDGGTIIADSTFIRLHLERTRGVDFDAGLSSGERAIAWAFEKMLEDHVYWILMHERWNDPVNFDRGPRRYFDAVPAPLRPFVIAMVRRSVRSNLHAQGTSRFDASERAELARRAADALSVQLGDKPWLMGDEPVGVDATAFAFVDASLCPLFPGPLAQSVRAHANLVAYGARGRQRWFADLPTA